MISRVEQKKVQSNAVKGDLLQRLRQLTKAKLERDIVSCVHKHTGASVSISREAGETTTPI